MCMGKTKCSVYIDEAGDLGRCRGTRWFVISAVIVDNTQEPKIRNTISQIKRRTNVNDIHMRKIKDFNKRAYIVSELAKEDFTYISVVVDTNILNTSSLLAYNYTCRLLLERVSWFLRDTNREGDVVLSSRGTARDGELIKYITDKLLPDISNQVYDVFMKVKAKAASSWDMLQLADVCATSTFLAYEVNGWGFRTPCYAKKLKQHVYTYKSKMDNYGLKYLAPDMKPSREYLIENLICRQ